MFVTTWLPGNVQRRAQPVTADVPALRTVTSPLKLLPQSDRWYRTVHAPAGGGLLLALGLALGLLEGLLDGLALADGLVVVGVGSTVPAIASAAVFSTVAVLDG